MMKMNEKDVAGSSCKRQENGDVPSCSDRPLKKARYAWQVKGKYHLKNQITESIAVSASNEEELGVLSSSDSENDPSDIVGTTEQNLEILGDYLLKQDFNTLGSVIADTDKSFLTPCTSISADTLSYPKYSIHSNNHVNRRDSLENLAVPMSVIHQFGFTEDQCIARWQAKQMAKGYVDNTINRVLDSWMINPRLGEVHNQFVALDVAEFINNLPGDNSIENEGILMAISAHGLQNASSSSSVHKDLKTDSAKDFYPSPPNSPVLSDDENNRVSKSDVICESSNDNWTEQLADNSYTSFNIFQDVSSSSYHNIDSNLKNSQCNSICESETTNSNDIFTNHFDFMDAAVSYAIQNKGLASFSSDYGL